jgi:hypothetical protein
MGLVIRALLNDVLHPTSTSRPCAGAAGTVRLPGSKSISNRVLLLAGLSAGTTTVHDLLDSDDTRVMLDALRATGLRRGASWTAHAPSPSTGRADCAPRRRACSWAMPAPPCAR